MNTTGVAGRPRDKRLWTFGRSIAIGFAAVVGLNLVVAGIALEGLNSVVERKDRVIDHDSQLVLDVQKLLTIRDARAAANRGYLLSGNATYLDAQHEYDDRFDQQIGAIRNRIDTARGRTLLDQAEALQHNFVLLDLEPVELRQKDASMAKVIASWNKINEERVATQGATDTLFTYQSELVKAASRKRARPRPPTSS